MLNASASGAGGLCLRLHIHRAGTEVAQHHRHFPPPATESINRSDGHALSVDSLLTVPALLRLRVREIDRADENQKVHSRQNDHPVRTTPRAPVPHLSIACRTAATTGTYRSVAVRAICMQQFLSQV
jgi:hypothetical protein